MQEMETELIEDKKKISILENRLEHAEARARRFFQKRRQAEKELAQFDREVRDLVGVPASGSSTN
jgi:chromosome segregation ATPase